MPGKQWPLELEPHGKYNAEAIGPVTPYQEKRHYGLKRAEKNFSVRPSEWALQEKSRS